MADALDDLQPIHFIPIGIGIGAALAGLGYALKLTLPALGQGLGNFLGTTISIASHGAAESGIVATVIAPVFLASTAVAGLTGGYVLLVRTIHTAKSDPFAWTLPVLALWAGAFTEISKNFDGAGELQNSIYSVLAGAATLVGGMLFAEKNTLLKACGLLLTLVPALGFLAIVLISKGGGRYRDASSVGGLAWFAFAIFLLTSVAVAILAQRASRKA